MWNAYTSASPRSPARSRTDRTSVRWPATSLDHGVGPDRLRVAVDRALGKWVVAEPGAIGPVVGSSRPLEPFLTGAALVVLVATVLAVGVVWLSRGAQAHGMHPGSRPPAHPMMTTRRRPPESIRL